MIIKNIKEIYYEKRIHLYPPAQRRSKNLLKILSLFLFLLCMLSLAFIALLFVKKATPQYALSKIGFKYKEPTDWSRISWNSSLEQLNFDSDIVFIGDSLTCGENFQESFPDLKVLNLGLSGDTIKGVSERSYVISNFTPEKIFIECGVNSFKSTSSAEMLKQYDEMITELSTENPSAIIYIQSIFPISNSNESGNLTNKNIIAFNEKLKSLATNHDASYIDIYSQYVKDGQMNAEYTKDGVHLKDEYKHLWIDAISEYIE